MQVPSVALRTVKTRLWCVVIVVVVATVADVASLNGPNVCMVKQKYNITIRVKYRAPMSVRTYEWCFSMPPRCSRWTTEMKDLTRLETEERTAEVAVCCPGYKMKEVSCVPICPNGKTGPRCSDDCPARKWGPNCVHNCTNCANHGTCSPVTGECECDAGWQGESCEIRMSTTQASTTMMEEILTTTKSTTNTNSLPTNGTSVFKTTVSNASNFSNTTVVMSTLKIPIASGSSSSSISTTITSPITTTSTISITRMNDNHSRELSTSERIITTTVRSKDLVYSPELANPSENLQSTVSLKDPLPIIVYDEASATTTVMTPTTKTTIQETTSTRATTKSIYNRTEPSIEIESTTPLSQSMLSPSTKLVFTTTATMNRTPSSTVQTIVNSSMSISSSTEKEYSTKTEVTRKPESTVRPSSTAKFKPKEIWIKPTQKGESTIIDFKIKSNHELTHLRHRSATKKEVTSELTTPRTIIVSIIPTSVSYSTFKRIALTTSSYFTARNATSKLNKTENGLTYSMISHTSLPPFIKKAMPSTTTSKSTYPSTFTPIISKNVTKLESVVNKKGITSQITIPVPITTNSMTSMEENTSRLNYSNSLTTVSSSINSLATLVHESVTENITMKPNEKTFKRNNVYVTTKAVVSSTHNSANISQIVNNKLLSNIKATDVRPNITEKSNESVMNITNVSNTKHLITTEDPVEDETFHILTEPEHITAVMSDKERDRSSMDLISVVSIAGGVMMAIITVAVMIVMIERCRRPRFDDIRKVNDIRMQVMIDNSDVPPPYSRSIFHTPLPDPPALEKCHYQPISTLDRNLKQFMRPVVVQNISPIMLENFRGILECHYDHLPRRNHDFGTMPSRLASAPSISYNQELRSHKSRSVNDSTIDAIRCEAKLDVIDSTTSEPLYAEIPCWRPPSEHAIEVVNGEAITEL